MDSVTYCDNVLLPQLHFLNFEINGQHHINSRRKVFLKLNNCSLGQDIYHFLLNITFSSRPILCFTALCYCHSTVHCHNLRSTQISHELYFPFILPHINFRTFPISHIFFVFACLYVLFNVPAIKSGITVPRCMFVQT